MPENFQSSNRAPLPVGKAPLPHGVWHEATVMGIQHAADSFTKSGTTETIFCHFINLLVKEKGTNGRLVKAQMCNTHQQLTFFRVNDEIKYNTNKYVPAKDRYTISSYEVTKSATQKKIDPDFLFGADITDDVLPIGDMGHEEIPYELKAAPATQRMFDTLAASAEKKADPINGCKGEAVEMPKSVVSETVWHSNVAPKVDKVQVMVAAQHNAALCYQMRGNFSEKDILSLSQSFYEQILGVLDDQPKTEAGKPVKGKGKVK